MFVILRRYSHFKDFNTRRRNQHVNACDKSIRTFKKPQAFYLHGIFCFFDPTNADLGRRTPALGDPHPAHVHAPQWPAEKETEFKKMTLLVDAALLPLLTVWTLSFQAQALEVRVHLHKSALVRSQSSTGMAKKIPKGIEMIRGQSKRPRDSEAKRKEHAGRAGPGPALVEKFHLVAKQPRHKTHMFQKGSCAVIRHPLYLFHAYSSSGCTLQQQSLFHCWLMPLSFPC